MNKLLATALLAAAATASAIPSGSSISRTATVTTNSTWADINLQKFNSGWGTLTGITLTLDYADIAGSFTAGTNASAVVDSADGKVWLKQVTSVGFSPINSGWVTLDTSPVLPDTISNTTRNYTVNSTSAFGLSTWNITPTNFAAFQSANGTGNVTFQTRTTAQVSIIGGQGSFDTSLVTGTAKMTVTYNYTPVPEASTYGIALGGLAIAAAVVRRRKISK